MLGFFKRKVFKTFMLPRGVIRRYHCWKRMAWDSREGLRGMAYFMESSNSNYNYAHRGHANKLSIVFFFWLGLMNLSPDLGERNGAYKWCCL